MRKPYTKAEQCGHVHGLQEWVCKHEAGTPEGSCFCQLRPKIGHTHRIRSHFKPSLICLSTHGSWNTTFRSVSIRAQILLLLFYITLPTSFLECQFCAIMSRPYLCSDPNLSDHSSSEGGFVSIFGFAVSALSTSSAMDVKGVRKP